MLEPWQLKQRQGLELPVKIQRSKLRIREFYEHYNGQVYVAFSGGKDSTVLLDLVRSIYPDVPAVFVDTGLEFPEIREFVKQTNNVTWLKPEMNFKKVIKKHGFPVVSKRVSMMIRDLQNPTPSNLKSREGFLSGEYSHSLTLSKKWYKLIDAPFKVSDRCCNVMKKKPFKKYEKENGGKPFVGLMASDSEARLQNYLHNGCNIFEGKKSKSRPISFWLEQDIWDYLHQFNLPYSTIYDMGYRRTGCVFCMFGAHMNFPNRFQIMAKTHPKLYKYCLDKLGLREVLEYIGVDYVPLTPLESFNEGESDG